MTLSDSLSIMLPEGTRRIIGIPLREGPRKHQDSTFETSHSERSEECGAVTGKAGSSSLLGMTKHLRCLRWLHRNEHRPEIRNHGVRPCPGGPERGAELARSPRTPFRTFH